MGDQLDAEVGLGQWPGLADPAAQGVAEPPALQNFELTQFRAFEAWRAANVGPNAPPLPVQAALAALPPPPVEAAPPWASQMVAEILRNQQMMDGGHSFHSPANAAVHGGLQAIVSMTPGKSGRWREIGDI
jgi:hypothetical protein